MTEPRWRRRAGVIETDLGAELILLDPSTQEMFSLNSTGRVAWRALEGATLTELVAHVVRTFDVTAELAEPDVRSLLRRLAEATLVERDL